MVGDLFVYLWMLICLSLDGDLFFVYGWRFVLFVFFFLLWIEFCLLVCEWIFICLSLDGDLSVSLSMEISFSISGWRFVFVSVDGDLFSF